MLDFKKNIAKLPQKFFQGGFAMLSFSIPVKSGNTKKFFDFTVESRVLLFAGSRYLSVNNQTSSDLINAFGSIGFSFLIGCATGVDESFRKALSCSDYKDRTIVNGSIYYHFF